MCFFVCLVGWLIGFGPEGSLPFFPNLYFRFLSLYETCFLNPNLSPSSCSLTPFPGLVPLEGEWMALHTPPFYVTPFWRPNALIQASQGPASPTSFCQPRSSFSSYFSPTFQSQPLPPPHHLKFSSKLADTHGEFFPQSPSLCPFKVLMGEG